MMFIKLCHISVFASLVTSPLMMVDGLATPTRASPTLHLEGDSVADLVRRQGVSKETSAIPGLNCSSLDTGTRSECFLELDIPGYIRNWVSTNECFPDEGFFSCYLRRNKKAGFDCDIIAAADSCPPPTSDNPEPKVYYTVYNIHGKLIPWQLSLH